MTMKFTPTRIVAGLVVLAVIGVGGAYAATAVFGDIGGNPQAQLPTPVAPQLIRRGKYIAEAGDCAACHTAPGGKPFRWWPADRDPDRHDLHHQHHAGRGHRHRPL